MIKDTLLYLAQNQRMRDFVIQNSLTRNASRRFVAGEALEEGIQAARALNQQGMTVALDYLGENVSDAREAETTTKDYVAALNRIQQADINANISIKLTALGLDISQELCEENLRAILHQAAQHQIFICIDMEGSAYTEQTVNMALRSHDQFEHVGTVIQAYLYRSEKDIENLIAHGIRVRLVKGAYKEDHTVAYQDKSEVDRNYVHLMTKLLARGNFPAIATHDEAIIDAARSFVRNHGISKSAFEFQMLYGIRRDLQEKLVQQGYNLRIYVPYGSQWYPYLMRRMAERPSNLMFVMSNILRFSM
jgi:proline dehydrogenase